MLQSRPALCTWLRSSMLGPVGSWVTPSAARSMHGSLLLHSRPPSAPAIRQGVACIIPTVVAVCLRRLSRRLAKARSHRLHGPARQSLRQRQDRELHEDTQGRSRVSDGVRNLRGRYSRPSPLHRRGLQHSQTPLRARLSEPRAIRGSPRPATCQNRRLKLSTIRGALHYSLHWLTILSSTT